MPTPDPDIDAAISAALLSPICLAVHITRHFPVLTSLARHMITAFFGAQLFWYVARWFRGTLHRYDMVLFVCLTVVVWTVVREM